MAATVEKQGMDAATQPAVLTSIHSETPSPTGDAAPSYSGSSIASYTCVEIASQKHSEVSQTPIKLTMKVNYHNSLSTQDR